MMKHYNIINAISCFVLSGLWLYLGLTDLKYYYILSLLSAIAAIVNLIRHIKEKRK